MWLIPYERTSFERSSRETGLLVAWPVTVQNPKMSSLGLRLTKLERVKKVDAEKSKIGTLRTVQPATEARLSASVVGRKGKKLRSGPKKKALPTM